ncbi:4-hydroxy-tetrahydrodipicolinate synthase [Sphingosinicella sp. BN140058]|uniref:4-hydroxy-tetrahydrodipicolinate synthase n=1 Tax=Sphingosinicella sp. BN140058 TaxID=1892855 RepID=UPI00101336CF|nr:4-hydroxy-tetrahydrodipicolinate synthase [Sphingosinicella sp. BN140058]QAY80062.1 4-hydroxy-tetrahydrodipicolinate synthase [Sphingosinicella sp. BN140058]
MFRGSIPALVTPFRDEAFDEGCYREFVEWQIAEGSHGLAPVGTTGESATLVAEDHYRVVATCVDQGKGRVPVIAGCGSNSTQSAIQNMKAAQDCGADAALIVLPYYNRPNQDGLVRHFEMLVEACDLPIVVYNVPGRTVTDINVETLARISKLPSVVAIKDASGQLARVSAQRLACGADFVQLSGNDDMTLGFMAMGGVGSISVTANVAPRLCADFHEACLNGDWAGALALQDRLYPLHAALFSDASPGPTKYALSRILADFPMDLRLPMTPPSEASRRAVDAALDHAGIAVSERRA